MQRHVIDDFNLTLFTMSSAVANAVVRGWGLERLEFPTLGVEGGYINTGGWTFGNLGARAVGDRGHHRARRLLAARVQETAPRVTPPRPAAPDVPCRAGGACQEDWEGA